MAKGETSKFWEKNGNHQLQRWRDNGGRGSESILIRDPDAKWIAE